jgi:hypothetical protein
MAMMKYGRTTKMTSPPDKVVKNKDGTTTTTSGKTSVTMSDWIKPEKTPTPKNMISEDEYNTMVAKRREVEARNEAKMKPYNDAVAAYKQEQEDYASGMEQYKRAYDFYNMGPEPTKEDQGSVKVTKGGKTRKGEDVTFEPAERYSAAQANADLQRALKENKNLVNIYDKSINPASRKIYLEQYGKDNLDNLYGRTTGEKYVDRDVINKIKSPRDIWGEDFDAVEWDKASESKDPDAFDKYLTKKGYQGRTFAAKQGMGYYNKYVTPTPLAKPTSKMPVKPNIEEEKLPVLPKASSVAVSKLPTRKVVRIESTAKEKYSKFIPDKEIEEGDWKDPTGGKFKRKGAIVPTAHAAAKGPQGAGGGQTTSIRLSPFSKKIGPDKGYGIQRGPGSGEAKGVRAREEKMAKAFYAPESEWGRGGYYSSMEGTEGNVSKAIRSEIKDIRSEKKDWKKQTSLTGAAKRAGAREVFKEDIKTGRQAARYARRGDLKSLDTNPLTDESGGVWKAGQKSKLKIYTPEITKYGKEGAMSGYVAAAEKNIEAAKKYQQNEMTAKSNQLRADFNKQSWKNYGEEGFIQKAEDNATNRNTVIAQMEKYKGWGSKIK